MVQKFKVGFLSPLSEQNTRRGVLFREACRDGVGKGPYMDGAAKEIDTQHNPRACILYGCKPSPFANGDFNAPYIFGIANLQTASSVHAKCYFEQGLGLALL